MRCEFCDVELEEKRADVNGETRTLLVCPRDLVVTHPPTVWVPVPVEPDQR